MKWMWALLAVAAAGGGWYYLAPPGSIIIPAPFASLDARNPNGIVKGIFGRDNQGKFAIPNPARAARSLAEDAAMEYQSLEGRIASAGAALTDDVSKNIYGAKERARDFAARALGLATSTGTRASPQTCEK